MGIIDTEITVRCTIYCAKEFDDNVKKGRRNKFFKKEK